MFICRNCLILCALTHATILSSPYSYLSSLLIFLTHQFFQFFCSISLVLLFFPTLAALPPPYSVLPRSQMHM